MKRVLLPLLLLVLLTSACKSKCECEKKGGPALRASSTVTLSTRRVERATAADEIQQVSGPSTIFVRQSGHVRYMTYWPHAGAGSITIPLQAIDDRSGSPFYISVQRGGIPEWLSDALMHTRCPTCTSPRQDVGCCP